MRAYITCIRICATVITSRLLVVADSCPDWQKNLEESSLHVLGVILTLCHEQVNCLFPTPVIQQFDRLVLQFPWREMAGNVTALFELKTLDGPSTNPHIHLAGLAR
ncbi:hypothetical protein P175DRAFT_0557794 [Aspergillus ochraceoroseus IBT 24754]|uniref:Secreted protein n=1 Tax=Aspergillus ochraceoroseus IBT 24754 TaxID=1392256 RepID=A0A2T5LXU9_9EURO|nr:uncharacterized protein P175DRAFT_0557794 [Aspergillus ochraceoroseus IBT 24754]PTU21115.1 hypothetical protein P175DRAFT_0557794 [Aspergillus ochraceoroseus IBT 24754]